MCACARPEGERVATVAPWLAEHPTAEENGSRDRPLVRLAGCHRTSLLRWKSPDYEFSRPHELSTPLVVDGCHLTLLRPIVHLPHTTVDSRRADAVCWGSLSAHVLSPRLGRSRRSDASHSLQHQPVSV